MMCCDTKNTAMNNGTGRNTSVIRFIALAIFMCIVATLLLSGAFILTHAAHEHDHNGPGDTCATCAQLAAAETILKQLLTALAVASVAIAGAFALVSRLCVAAPRLASYTLVELKVRLNN